MKVTIIGAGLVGALEACLMARRGHEVTVYDMRPDLRKTPNSSVRSINLVLNVRGIEALEQIGLDRMVLETLCVPMTKRVIRTKSLNVKAPFAKGPWGSEGVLYSLDRRQMNETLLTAAEKHENVQLVFNHKLTDMDADSGWMTLMDNTTGRSFKSYADLIIGCDGLHSTVRRMIMDTPGFNLTQEHIEHFYKELRIPPTADGQFAINPDVVTSWLMGDVLMFGIPTVGKSINVMMMSTAESFKALANEQQVIDFFERHFPDILAKVEPKKLAADLLASKPYALSTLKCGPLHRGKCLLMGDSAHTALLFHGQGMNCGFQDALCLERLIDQHGDSAMEQVLALYSDQRVPEGRASADLSVALYKDLKALANDNWATMLRMVVGGIFNRISPKNWPVDLDTVGLTLQPYAEIQSEKHRQDRFLQRLLVATQSLLAIASVALSVVLTRSFF